MDSTSSKWSLHIPEALFFTNQLPRQSLDGLSAFECIFGRSFLYPFSIDLRPTEKPVPFQKALQSYIDELHPALLAHQVARHKKLLEGETPHKVPVLEKGDRCLVFRPNLKSSKLSLAWDGPYRVEAKRCAHSYVLKHTQTGRVFLRHISHIRPLPKKDVFSKQTLKTSWIKKVIHWIAMILGGP